MSTAMKSLRIPALVALTLSGGLAHSVNLVTNGSFETAAATFTAPTVGNFQSLVSATFNAGAMASWTVDVDRLAWLHGPIAAGGPVLTAQDGNLFLDLTDTQLSNPFGGLTTTINTTPGTFYTLSYYLGTSAFFNPVGGTAALVSIAGLNFNAAVTSTMAASSWEFKSSVFQAVGPTTTISFVGVAGSDYIGLDNVSVSVVPEPMGIALALAGMGIVGAGLGKRRSVS